MNLGFLQYERDLIAGFRRVHAALNKRAVSKGYEDAAELAEHVHPDAWQQITAEECEKANVDPAAFTAWASQPDPDTEILDSMGYFNP